MAILAPSYIHSEAKKAATYRLDKNQVLLGDRDDSRRKSRIIYEAKCWLHLLCSCGARVSDSTCRTAIRLYPERVMKR